MFNDLKGPRKRNLESIFDRQFSLISLMDMGWDKLHFGNQLCAAHPEQNVLLKKSLIE
ncbi:hypothetical protein JW964_03955 [candidate division KSB1 bacterium]|nr:hypothetical protein [candidate division KSB1 bacterium]